MPTFAVNVPGFGWSCICLWEKCALAEWKMYTGTIPAKIDTMFHLIGLLKARKWSSATTVLSNSTVTLMDNRKTTNLRQAAAQSFFSVGVCLWMFSTVVGSHLGKGVSGVVHLVRRASSFENSERIRLEVG